MSTPLKYWQLAAALLVIHGAIFASTSFKLNGTCLTGLGFGNCPPGTGVAGGALTFGTSTSGSDSEILTLGNGDAYDVAWTWSGSYDANGTNLAFAPVLTYIGAGPSLGNDSIDFNMFQTFYAPGPGSYDGLYSVNLPLKLVGTFGAGSFVSAFLQYGAGGPAQSLGTGTQTGPGFTDYQNSATLTGLTGNTLTAEFEYTFDFKKGTLTGAAEGDLPEPAQTFPVALVLAGLGYRALVQRRSRYSK